MKAALVMLSDSPFGRFRRRPMMSFSNLSAMFGLLMCAFTAPAIAEALRLSAPPRAVVVPPDLCKRLTVRLPSISTATCQNSALVATGATSLRGVPILMRDIPATSKNSGKTPIRVMLIGGIHGDELTASAIVFRWLQSMKTAQAQEFNWRVIPVLNPDGLLANKPQRVNANGVDLNRNFPTPGWKQEAPRYWKNTTGNDPRRFPGKGPLSEPETRWLDEEMARFKPNVIISVHAPFGVLDFDGPVKPPQRFGRLVLTPVGVYPGSLGNYGGMHKNVPVITIELPNAQTMPTDAEVERIWQDMLAWIQRNVPKSATPPVQRAAEKASAIAKR